MKRIFYAVMVTLSGLVLLFSYRTSQGAQLPLAASGALSTKAVAAPPAPARAQGDDDGHGDDGPSAAPSKTPAPAPAAPAPAQAGLKTGTFTGGAVDTPYGPVQVAIEVSGGKVARVDILQAPNDNGRSRQIAAASLPTLESETISAQSSKIDMVSGATYTSDGYRQSLQSALDQAV